MHPPTSSLRRAVARNPHKGRRSCGDGFARRAWLIADRLLPCRAACRVRRTRAAAVQGAAGPARDLARFLPGRRLRTAQAEPVKGSYSIDPAVFRDTDGKYYLYFGGIWGGQLQRWASGTYTPNDTYPAKDQPALSAKIARVGDDMVSFAEAPKDVVLLDENRKPLLAGDNGRRFFEAAWLHKYNGTYYFSYSTGDTHFIMYATGTSPYGPFTVRGKILEPVLGWTNHHSIVEFQGKWYLFYHDAQVSGGQTHLRNIKVTELKYRADGSIVTVDAYIE